MPYNVNEVPYTNFHELNLDWIIKQMKALKSVSSLNDLLKLSYDADVAGSGVDARMTSAFEVMRPEGSTENRVTLPLTTANYYHRGSSSAAGDYFTVDSDGIIHIKEFGLYEITARIVVSPDSNTHRSFYITGNVGTDNAFTLYTMIGKSDVENTLVEILLPGDTFCLRAGYDDSSYTVQPSTLFKIKKLI